MVGRKADENYANIGVGNQRIGEYMGCCGK